MLESAEVGHRVTRAQYSRRAPKLRVELINAQYDLKQSARGPVLVIVTGVEAAGRHETANQLTSWMDPRYIHVAAFGDPSPDEVLHPPAWRYWQALPARGEIGVFMNAWYGELLAARIAETLDDVAFDDHLMHVRENEEALAAEGVTLVKFWIHLSKVAQKERIARIEGDQDARWQVTGRDRKALRHYNRHRPSWEHMLRTTSSGFAPWYVIEGADTRYREITIATIVRDALLGAIAARTADPVRVAPAPPAPAVVGSVERIRRIDLRRRLSERAYEESLARYQRELARLTRHKRFRDHALVLGFEGVDAAGKGGTIRRVASALDARQYDIVPVAAPNDLERAYPYLWRFWHRVPRLGGITIFDRTWYGRVLVERVEAYCTSAEWMRAYDEINAFEAELASAGIVVCKFWLQISKAEQLLRFKAREKTPFKRFKITADDLRNRRKWSAYEQAVADMVERTSTDVVPWTLIAAEDKRYGRIEVLRTICERLARALD